MSTTNVKIRYMFLTQEGFANQLKQMFKSPEEESVAEDKLENIQQTTSAMAYSTEFQMWATRTNWNKKALIAKYRQELKSKVQDTLILIEDTDSIMDLIK